LVSKQDKNKKDKDYLWIKSSIDQL